jgi:hypothetical protein
VAKVSFEFSAPQALVKLFVAAGGTAVPVPLRGGKGSIGLDAGSYQALYVAMGTPGTPFNLKCTGGGTMDEVKRTIPDDGNAAGNRKLVVKEG